MTSFVFEEELTAAGVQAARIVHGMVMASLEGGELPPKDVLEWFTKLTVYQFAQAEHDMLNSEDKEIAEKAREAVQHLAGEVRGLRALAADQKMFWMDAIIKDLLKVRLLRLPERYQSMLGPDMLP